MKGLSLGTGPETLSSEHFVNASCKTFSNATCFRDPIAPAAAAASQGERHAGAFGPWTVNITNVQQRVRVVAESPVASPPHNMANMKCRLGKVARRRGLLGFSPNPQLSAFHLHVSAASEYHLRRPDQGTRPRPRLATDEGGKCNPEFDSQLSPPLLGPASAARRTPTSHRRTSAPCQCGLLFKKLKGSCHANIYQRLFMLIPRLQNWPHRRPAHVVQ